MATNKLTEAEIISFSIEAYDNGVRDIKGFEHYLCVSDIEKEKRKFFRAGWSTTTRASIAFAKSLFEHYSREEYGSLINHYLKDCCDLKLVAAALKVLLREYKKGDKVTYDKCPDEVFTIFSISSSGDVACIRNDNNEHFVSLYDPTIRPLSKVEVEDSELVTIDE